MNKFLTLNHTLLYCLLFLFLSDYSFGQQNLILNGDFEEYWECPDDEAQIERCKYVFNPLPYELTGFSSTSDYFNVCFSGSISGVDAGVPMNFEGFQHSKSGSGMLGFWSYDNFINDVHHREYVQLSFSEKLKCGQKYRFTAYFNLSNYMRYSIKNLSFYFSEDELNNQDYLYNLYRPHYIDSVTMIGDTVLWTKLTFDFVANKPYKFVSIGNTEFSDSSSYFEVNPTALDQSFSTYFYIDLVSLYEVETVGFEIPNVFTPNNDGVNDVFQPIGGVTYFEKMLIYNRWGNEVANLSYPFQWNGTTHNGNEALEGVYFYLLNANESCKQEQKQGMIHLIR